MNTKDEEEFARLARHMANISETPGWEALRYKAIGELMEQLAQFCPVCDCQVKKSGNTK